ncbi:unnamed protein product [Heligmosomoides polygyrus]|uniref:PB1 domain-containing protein n=1 Tax=Heligmosomoides polygyrus TaxID=6339 RepID=A0A183GNV1_HELPZ|nr:unnamed protein product [Heligmosomoides polygyrus]
MVQSFTIRHLKNAHTRMPRITVTYKDKHDLFEAFKKKMAELGVSVDEVLWTDEEGELTRMNNADAVMKATEDCCLPQKLHVIDDADKQQSSSSCCDEFADHRRGCCTTDQNPEVHPRHVYLIPNTLNNVHGTSFESRTSYEVFRTSSESPGTYFPLFSLSIEGNRHFKNEFQILVERPRLPPGLKF